MSYFVIIRGALGVGKTTIARKLAKIIDASYFSIDKVLSENKLDRCGEEGIPAANFIKGNDLVIPAIKKSLAVGKPVIIDGCFYRKEQIEHFISKLGGKYFVFTLKAPLKICIARDKGRAKTYGKDAAAAVFNMVSEFDYGIVIETEGRTEEEVVIEIHDNLSGID